MDVAAELKNLMLKLGADKGVVDTINPESD